MDGDLNLQAYVPFKRLDLFQEILYLRFIKFTLMPSFDGHFIKIPVRLGALTPLIQNEACSWCPPTNSQKSSP